MKFTITKPNDEYVLYKGRKYRLTLYFDRVIEARRLVSDETLSTADGVRTALFMLCKGCFSSFFMDYGIDLKKECGRLLWCT